MGDLPKFSRYNFYRPEQHHILRYQRKNEPRANRILKEHGNLQQWSLKGRGLFSFSLPSFSMPSWKTLLGGAAMGYAGYKGAKAGTNWAVPNIKRTVAAAKDWVKGLNPLNTVPKNQEQINQTAKPGRQAFKTSTESLYHEPTTLYMDNVVTNGPAIDKTNTRTAVPGLKTTMYTDSQRKQKQNFKNIFDRLPRTTDTGKKLTAVSYDKKKGIMQALESNKNDTKSSKGTPMEIVGNEPTIHDNDIFYDAEGRSKKAYRLQATFHGGQKFKNHRIKPY
jgi:hypothetical protein